jgi:predicted ester cyclase
MTFVGSCCGRRRRPTKGGLNGPKRRRRGSRRRRLLQRRRLRAPAVAVGGRLDADEHATQRRLDGAEAQVEVARAWRGASPDGHGTVARAYASGDTVTLEITWTGTQSGPMRTPDGQELPPSNRRATVSACQVVEIEDGRIHATRHYFDLMTILTQIGVMEHAEAPA